MKNILTLSTVDRIKISNIKLKNAMKTDTSQTIKPKFKSSILSTSGPLGGIWNGGWR